MPHTRDPPCYLPTSPSERFWDFSRRAHLPGKRTEIKINSPPLVSRHGSSSASTPRVNFLRGRTSTPQFFSTCNKLSPAPAATATQWWQSPASPTGGLAQRCGCPPSRSEPKRAYTRWQQPEHQPQQSPPRHVSDRPPASHSRIAGRSQANASAGYRAISSQHGTPKAKAMGLPAR